MNPEVCDRCRLKYSLFKCENCQESFCSECDSYIHSISSKNDHIRKMIYSQSTHETISKLKSENESLNSILSNKDPKAYFENITKLNNDINFNPEEYDLMKKENVQLKEENKELVEQNTELIKQIEKITEECWQKLFEFEHFSFLAHILYNVLYQAHHY